MKWEPEETASPLCDVEAEVRSGMHAVNPNPLASGGSDAKHARPDSPGVLPHTLTLTISRSHSRRSGVGDFTTCLSATPEVPWASQDTDTPPLEKDYDGQAGLDVEATTVMGDDAGKDEYEDPGLWGWLDCLGAVLVNMICYGMTQTWGVFQQYYSTNELKDSSGMAISWIGAIQFWLCPMLGCISGPLFDAGYLKHLIIIGGTLYSFCFMMASLSTEYWQLLLSHGIGVGIGMGIIFSPSVSTLQHHFARSRYRTLAYGFQASGSAVAGVYFPICLNYMLPAVGFPWSMRILGFIVILFTIAAYITLSTTIPPRDKIAVLSPSVFNNPAYSIYIVGACFSSLAIYAPQSFGVTYATYRGVPLNLANYAVTISNGVSLIGRILPPFFAQRLGPINVLSAAALISGTVQMLWTLARNTPGILVYSAMYGIVSGAYGACLNPGAASFAPHTNQSGLYLGMCFFVTSWFWLAGTPITAQLIDNCGYLVASMFTGGVVLTAGVLIFISRTVRAKQVGTPRV